MTVMLKVVILFIIFLFSSLPASSHMCHDPFRPKEKLVLIPEERLIKIEEKGEFRIYVENTFSSVLWDLRLIVNSPAFEIETIPQSIARLVPGERSFYLVKLKLREGFKIGDYPLQISVEAKSAELKPSIERIDIEAERDIPELPTLELKPSEEEVLAPPKEQIKEPEKVTVRVERLPFWRQTYFYVILISGLVLILLWRKTR